MVQCRLCGQALPSEAAARRHLHRPALCRRQPRSPPRTATASPGREQLLQHMDTARPEPGPPRPQCPLCGEAAGPELEEHLRARHPHLLGDPGTRERRERREGGREGFLRGDQRTGSGVKLEQRRYLDTVVYSRRGQKFVLTNWPKCW